MLFIAMIDAADLAAFNASGDRRGANSARTAAVTVGLRDARAEAMKVPARTSSDRAGSPAREPRFRRRSFAYSGRTVFKDSRDMNIPCAEAEQRRPGRGPGVD